MAEAERHEYGRFRGNVLRSVVILGAMTRKNQLRLAATQPRIGQRYG